MSSHYDREPNNWSFSRSLGKKVAAGSILGFIGVCGIGLYDAATNGETEHRSTLPSTSEMSHSHAETNSFIVPTVGTSLLVAGSLFAYRKFKMDTISDVESVETVTEKPSVLDDSSFIHTPHTFERYMSNIEFANATIGLVWEKDKLQ